MKRKRFRLVDPRTFNDPFELRGREIEVPGATTLHDELVDMYAENFRLLCCSHTSDSILMWSHYGDKHRGMVLEIETSEIRPDLAIEEHALDVKYRTNMPILPLFADTQAQGEARIMAVVSTKSADWSYEEEVRIHISLNDVTQDNRHFELGFEASCIKRIILGCRFRPSPEPDLNLDTILGDPAYSHVIVENARKHETEYKLRFAVRSP